MHSLHLDLFSNLKYSKIFRRERRSVVIRALPLQSDKVIEEPLHITETSAHKKKMMTKATYKRSRHALTIAPVNMQPKNLGFGFNEGSGGGDYYYC